MRKQLRLIGLVLSVIPLVLLSSGGVVSAHELQEDNGISGILHIPPDDNPQAGQPTELDESFGDQKNAFSLQDCDCAVVVSRDGSLVQRVIPRPALAGAILNSVVTVKFPSVGTYQVRFEGRAKDGAFPSFTLTYQVRVSTVAGGAVRTSGQGQVILIISLTNLIILAMIGLVAVRRGGRYAKNKDSSK